MSPTAAALPDAEIPPASRESVGSYLRFVAVMVLAVLAFRSFAFTPFSIPSESMLPGLAKGDYLIAAKWPYGYSRWSLPFDVPLIPGKIGARLPERGDVAIFRHPIDGMEYIKRVIGLPGDSVAMRRGRLILNGAEIPQTRVSDFVLAMGSGDECAWGGARERDASGNPICRYARFEERLPGGRRYPVLDFGGTPQDDFAAVTVPAGHVFMLGDNRDNSQDSRFPARAGGGVGLVPAERLVGRFEMVLFSTARWPNWLRLGSSSKGTMQ